MASLREIKAFGMQHPTENRVVPRVDYVNTDTIRALVDFHEGKCNIPAEQYGALARQVLAADGLGDDVFVVFVQHIRNSLKEQITLINCSNKMQNVKMVLWDKMHLKDVVPTLETSAHCYVCKYVTLRHSDQIVDSLCCERSFHHSCLLEVSECPCCKEAWGGLPCAACGQPTVRDADRELFFSYERWRNGRMECCGVNVHPK